jgi:PAS domain S-box-containing protein
MSYKGNVFGTYLLVWVGLCMFVGSVLFLLYSSDYETEMAAINLAEKNSVQQARDNIESDLSSVISNLRYLASQSSLGTFLDYPTEQTLRRLSQEFASELRARDENYFQLRFIGLNGQEIARVNNRHGQTKIVPNNKLQNKSERYYFKKSLELETSRDIYISPIDLNVEQGNIVVPHQPVIRFAMKIFRDNVPRGILVLNYDVKNILNSLVKFDEELWLVNKDGYWLAGPDDELEWGFMFPGRNNARFQDRYPEVWRQTVVDKVEYQELQEQGLFTYAGVSLEVPGRISRAGESVADSQDLHVFSNIPKAQIDEVFAEVKVRYLILLISSVLIISFSIYFLYRSSLLMDKSEEVARRNKLKFEQVVENAPDAMVVCRPDGNIVLVNKQTERLFGYSRNELIGKQVEILIPKQKRDQHSDHVKSYVEEPTIRPMGFGDYDLIALGKGGKEFPVSISLSPIDSGKDMLVVSAIRDMRLEQHTKKK